MMGEAAGNPYRIPGKAAGKLQPVRECRIGIISRIDLGSPGFRQALLELVAEVFRRRNVHFIVLAGGLIAGGFIKDERTRLHREISELKKIARRFVAAIKDLSTRGRSYSKEEARLEKVEEEIDKRSKELKELEPSRLAERLAEAIPHFVNAAGQPVKLHILTSPAYDKIDGPIVGQMLHDLRPDDIKHYPNSSHRFEAQQAGGKWVYVLTPPKRPWLRGDFFSTPNERVVRDKLRQTARELPDLFVTGCFGTSILIPDRFPRPVVCAPDLNRIEEANVSDNQIGVQVITVYADRVLPDVFTESMKDQVKDERKNVVRLPPKLKPNAKRLIDELIKSEGQVSTGQLAESTGLHRDSIYKLLRGHIKDGSRNTSWPGLAYFPAARLWDFPLRWMQRRLRYKPILERKKLRMLVVGCVHIGYRMSDYNYMVEEVPRVMCERGCDVFSIAGDSIAGLKHNLMHRGELIGYLNYTDQELRAGRLYAAMITQVARVRFPSLFDEAIARNDGKPLAHDDVAKVISASFPDISIIKGNHDEWEEDDGHTPLVVMKKEMRDRIAARFSKMLGERGLCLPDLHEIIERKIIQLDEHEDDVRYVFDEGMYKAMSHPHMGDTKTASIRLQSEMDTCSDAQVVVVANFHRGLHLCQWGPDGGQQVGIQCGTAAHGTKFERRKQKRIGRGQGFGWLEVEHANRRVLASTATFYTNDIRNFRRLTEISQLDALIEQYAAL